MKIDASILIVLTLFFFSCTKKLEKKNYQDFIAKTLNQTLQKKNPNFSKFASFNSYTREFFQRYQNLTQNQSLIIKINSLLQQKKFNQAIKQLQREIRQNGKSNISQNIQDLFKSAQAIDDYHLSHPFEDTIENAQAIARLQTQTKIFNNKSLFTNFLAKEKQKLKERIDSENQLIYKSLQLYSDLLQIQDYPYFNTAFLLSAFLLPNSLEAKIIQDKAPITLENPITEELWLREHHTQNNSKSLLQLISELQPATLTGILTRLEFSLQTSNKLQALAYTKSLLNTKLISLEKLAKIIQKKYKITPHNSILSINDTLQKMLAF